jgi:hypothetical protein
MRTTLRIDDDLMRDLRRRAAEQKVSLSRLFNQLLRQGLAAKPAKRAAYRERVYSLGPPRVSLDKALALAAADEDAEVTRKLMARK